MVTDDEAEKAADFLRDNASKAGKLRGLRIYAEEYRKSLKAILMNQSNATTIADREAGAYSDPRYLDHLNKLREAVQADEENRALREGANMRIEVWRTQSSNLRGRL
jgi:uncharacterized protein YpiB (UPF0302 family)